MAIDPNMLIAALAGTMGGNPMGVNAGGMPQPMQAAPLSLAPPKPPGLFARMGQNFQNSGGLEALMGNPLFGAGIGAMSAGRNGNPYQAALAGMYGSQLYKQRTQENELRMQEAKEQRERAMTVAKLAQEGLKTLDVDQDGNISPAEQARGDYLRAAAQTGDQSFLTKATDTLASLQEQNKPTPLQANLAAAGLVPGTPEYQNAVLQSVFKPQVQVTNQERIPPPPPNYRYVDPQRPEIGLEFIPGGGADPANPQTWSEGERAAAGYRQRMQAVEQALASVPTPTDADFFTTFGSKGTLQNLLSSPEYREYTNLASDWIRAKLRKESGAVIGDEEMAEEFKLYFWTPGDDEKDARRKLARRIMADRQMALTAGRAVVTPEARAKELRAAGFNDEEIADQLLQEGLIRD